VLPTMAELLDKIHYFTRGLLRRRNYGIVGKPNFLCSLHEVYEIECI
jgi:hypothetical protein